MLHHSISGRDFYRKFGFVVLYDLLPRNLIDRVASDTLELKNPLDKWTDNILELAYYPVVLKYLEYLYNYKAFPFQTLNFSKPPAIGIHSDTIHFSTDPHGLMCGVWVALEDVAMNNGPLNYYSKSHHLPVVYFEDLGIKPVKEYDGLIKNLGIYGEWLKKRNVELGLEPEIFTCMKGTVFIWDANLLHASSKPCNKIVTRLSQVTHYYFDYPGVKFTVPAYGRTHKKENVFALQKARK